jgi:hypothetical protein
MRTSIRPLMVLLIVVLGLLLVMPASAQDCAVEYRGNSGNWSRTCDPAESNWSFFSPFSDDGVPVNDGRASEAVHGNTYHNSRQLEGQTTDGREATQGYNYTYNYQQQQGNANIHNTVEDSDGSGREVCNSHRRFDLDDGEDTTHTSGNGC